MRWGTSPLWSPLHAMACAVWPALILLPIGSVAARHWAARSAIYAAQTVLLAAAARGLDSCPMEGFDARVEPQWRRPFSSVVIAY